MSLQKNLHFIKTIMHEFYAGTFLSLPEYKNKKIINAPEYMAIDPEWGLCGVPYSTDKEIVISFDDLTSIHLKLKSINQFGNFDQGYLRYGYGSSLEEYAPNFGKFQYDIDITPHFDNYYSECINTAQSAAYTAKENNLELMLFLSGGADSEAMAWLFLKNNIQFTPCIIKMTNEMNMFDIKFALKFCQDNNLTPKIIDFNPFAFLRDNAYMHYALKYRTTFPEMMMACWALDQVPHAYPIFPANIPFVVTNNNVTGFNLLIDQFRCIWRYLFLNQRLGIENFFYHTKKQYSSAIVDPVYQPFLFAKNMDYYDKIAIYNYFKMPVRPKPYKYTGWEKVRKFYSQRSEEITKKKNMQVIGKIYFHKIRKYFQIEDSVPGIMTYID